MKTRSIAFLPMLFGFVLALSALRAAAQDEGVSFQFFHDSLQPYGEWIEVGNYGLCWRPTGVTSDWAPYTDGYWCYTDEGWTWVSYEDFGGIVYHYGRWIPTDDVGWVWAADTEWGPAWVSWRANDEYVGWAPLPPECRWDPDTGVGAWADSYYDIGPGCYRFCHLSEFGAPFVAAVLAPQVQNVVIIRNTVNVTNIAFYRGQIFAGGPKFNAIFNHLRRPIPALKLVRQGQVGEAGHRPPLQSLQRGNALFVPAPHIQPFPSSAAILGAYAPARVVAASHVARGWSLVKNPVQRAELQARYAQETKGLTPQSAPAKPIEPGELKMIPEKANVPAPSPAGVAKTRLVTPAKEGNPVAARDLEGVGRQPVLGDATPSGAPGTPNAARKLPLPGQPIKVAPTNETAVRGRELPEVPQDVARSRAEGGIAAHEREVPSAAVRRGEEGPPAAMERPRPIQGVREPAPAEVRRVVPEAVERREPPGAAENRVREIQQPRAVPQSNPQYQQRVPQGGSGNGPNQGAGKGRRDDSAQGGR